MRLLKACIYQISPRFPPKFGDIPKIMKNWETSING